MSAGGAEKPFWWSPPSIGFRFVAGLPSITTTAASASRIARWVSLPFSSSSKVASGSCYTASEPESISNREVEESLVHLSSDSNHRSAFDEITRSTSLPFKSNLRNSRTSEERESDSLLASNANSRSDSISVVSIFTRRISLSFKSVIPAMMLKQELPAKSVLSELSRWLTLSLAPVLPSQPPPSLQPVKKTSRRVSNSEVREVRRSVTGFRPYVQKVPWHSGVRAFLSQLFPQYGHYCGPNWSSGRDGGSMLWDRRPVDWLDYCCYCHDMGYDTDDQAKLLQADLEFLECLEKPRMTTKGDLHAAVLYQSICIVGLRNILIPYRVQLLKLQEQQNVLEVFWSLFGKVGQGQGEAESENQDKLQTGGKPIEDT